MKLNYQKVLKWYFKLQEITHGHLLMKVLQKLSPQETLEQLLEGTVPYKEHPLLQHPINQLGYPIPLDADGLPITDYDVAYYRPYYDLQWEYSPWVSSQYYKQNYTPVRLADNTFFNSVVCREKDIPYNSCPDEYTIVGTEYRKLRLLI